jgi:hypothetical protein
MQEIEPQKFKTSHLWLLIDKDSALAYLPYMTSTQFQHPGIKSTPIMKE